MPIYEYLCEKCQHEFEREQRITDDPVKTCPACRSRKVKKLISQTSFVLKGGGWYSDLYSSTKKDTGDAASKTDAKGDAKETSSSESKDSKSESKSSDKSDGSGKTGGGDSKGKKGPKGKQGKKAAA